MIRNLNEFGYVRVGETIDLLHMERPFECCGYVESIFDGDTYSYMLDGTFTYSKYDNGDFLNSVTVEFEVLDNEHNRNIYVPDDKYFDYEVRVTALIQENDD